MHEREREKEMGNRSERVAPRPLQSAGRDTDPLPSLPLKTRCREVMRDQIFPYTRRVRDLGGSGKARREAAGSTVEACPMSVANNKIITVQKMGEATVEAKARGGGGWQSDDRCRQYSNSISLPVFFGSAPAPASVQHRLRPPPLRAVSFYFIGVQ